MYPLQVPIDGFHWALAIVPLVLLLILLVGLQWQAPEAGPVGMFVAAAIALVAFQTPWEGLAIATAKGIWDAIFILYVVWPALLLYHVIKRGGGFVALEEGIQRFSDNDLFLVLAFGWVFASFLQGIAGFGTPIAVVVPLLLVIGVRPVHAVAIPLIGHAWANMFGTLAVAWLATLQVIPLESELATTVETAILLIIPAAVAGVAIAWLFGRMPAVRYALPMIVVISTLHARIQLGLMFWDPILSTFLAGTVALVALYPLSRWERYDQPLEGIDERPAMDDGSDTSEASEDDIHVEKVRMSGFYGTHLEQVLRTQGIQTLFLAGVNIDQCVATTMEDAYFRDYNPILLRDAAATSSPDFCKEATVFNVELCWGFSMSVDSFEDPEPFEP